MEISLAFRDHPDENVLEEYAFGRLNEAEAAILEEHILVCEQCQLALAETDDYIRLMKFAASRPLDLPLRQRAIRSISIDSSTQPTFLLPPKQAFAELVTSAGKSTYEGVVLHCDPPHRLYFQIVGRFAHALDDARADGADFLRRKSPIRGPDREPV